MTVEELATLLASPPAAVISALIKNGIFATMNQVIDFDTASSVMAELGFEATEQTVPSADDDESVAEVERVERRQIGVAVVPAATRQVVPQARHSPIASAICRSHRESGTRCVEYSVPMPS
jgi:hypothetical protein